MSDMTVKSRETAAFPELWAPKFIAFLKEGYGARQLRADAIAGLLRLGTLVKHIPFPVTAGIAIIVFASQIRALLGRPVETIGSKFGGVPAGLPTLKLPPLSAERIRAVLPAALSFTLLGAIESCPPSWPTA